MRAPAKIAPVAAKKATNPMVMTITFILIATILGVVGQLLLKHGMTSMGTLDLVSTGVPTIIARMGTSPWVIGGLAVYCTGTFFWLMVLNRVPLSYSYPFVALGIVVGMLASWGIYHEQIPPMRWVGLAIICSGLLIVART
jgi:multidrug transporter EmrE-like cation transporter